jgi:hypothetical protein
MAQQAQAQASAVIYHEKKSLGAHVQRPSWAWLHTAHARHMRDAAMP